MVELWKFSVVSQNPVSLKAKSRRTRRAPRPRFARAGWRKSVGRQIDDQL